MASEKIITSITNYRYDTHRFRLNPENYELKVEQYQGGSWTKVGGWKTPVGDTNEFRFTFDSGDLVLQQLISGGTWSGTEGTDYNTIQYFSV